MNLKRNKQLKRIVVDEENIKFEIHPGVYLEIKEKALEVKQGMEFEDEDIGIKVKVNKTRRTVTKKAKNIPENTIWYDVTDSRTGVVTKCTQHFYHTTQTVHLQGGKNIGKTTTTSVMADHFEKEWMEVEEEKKEQIQLNTKILTNLDISKLQESRKTKMTKSKEPTFECNKCNYTSIFQYQMKVHMYSFHKIDNIKTIKRFSINKGSIKRPRPGLKTNRVEDIKPANEKVDEEVEIFLSNEASPLKKKSKENEPNIEPTNDEVLHVVENLQDKIRMAEERVRFLESEKGLLETKVNTMRAEHEAEKENARKVEQEKQLLQVEYDKCLKANQIVAKESENIKTEYKEAAQQLNFAQRKIEELVEKLKVTEAILEAQEEGEEDDEDDEENDEDEETKLPEDDDDYLEDADRPGQLWQVVQKENLCKKCDEKILGNKNFREHMQTHLLDKNKELSCYYCDFKTKNENVFLNHITSVHGAGHTCLTCNSTFKTQTDMISHVVEKHKKKDPVKEKCVSCGEEFTKLEHLTEHIVRHHTMLTSNGQANIAGKQLVQLWPQQEQQRNHNNINCFDCGNMFNNQGQLMIHKREKHFKQKLCNYYQRQGNCRFGEQCLNIHEVNYHMNQNHGYMRQFGQNSNNIQCRNGPNCEFKVQNRCRYVHSVSNVTNNSSSNPSYRNTDAFNMQELLVSLGARLDRIEQNVPDLMSLQDFPNIQDQRSKQKTA